MERTDYRLAAILYTDIAGFSKMMEKNEALTLELLQKHNDIIEAIVAKKGGTVIKTIGDAFLIDFRNTVDALQSAIDIQYQLYEYNKLHMDLPLLVRIGVHLGDIYFYKNDALGEGINIAARLQSVAHPGCICMSHDVYNHVLNKVEFKAEKLGRVSLKNITKEIHAYEIATPNIEFDPNRDARTILVPDKEEKAAAETGLAALVPPGGGQTATVTAAKSAVVRRATKTSSAGAMPLAPTKIVDTAVDAGEASTAGEQQQLHPSDDEARAKDIKRRIMLDIKSAGRRLSVDQMRIRYRSEGNLANSVIEDLAVKGFLLEDRASSNESTPDPDLRSDIVHTVNTLEYRIEDEIRRGLNAAFAHRRKYQDLHDHRPGRVEMRVRDRAIKDEVDEDRRGAGKWERRVDKSRFRSAADGLVDYEKYAKKTRSEASSAIAGFVGHALSFIAVNGVLMAINASTSPGFPWALFPLGGWGIGLLEHLVSVMRKAEKAKDLKRLPELDHEKLELFKALQKKKDGFWMHLSSTLTTTGFLAAINLLTSPGFLWFLIPGIGMAIGLFTHAASYAMKKSELEKSLLESFGLSGSWSRALRRMPAMAKETPEDLGPYQPLVDEAKAIRLSIIAQTGASSTDDSAKKGKGTRVGGKGSGEKGKGEKDKGDSTGFGAAWDGDLLPTLDSYVEQIGLLAKRTCEVDRIIDLIPMDALGKDKADLTLKMQEAVGVGLKKEYEKSLSEIEKQEKSFAELKEQQELMELRLRSSVNTMKQMRIDLARLSGMPAGGENAPMNAIRDKTAELNHYLDDLKAGYEELDRLEALALPATVGGDEGED